ncbi:MAG: DUF3431 domain-containing protein [Lachnospiraceae bacterium]|nr:DUF3431 domain-containing protein [Lachnospiraceae bacterium]
MKKTSNFFVIHNFNTIPEYLLEYCEDYLIYDCSTDEKTVEELTKRNYNFRRIPNTGHNITTYFQYFAECYENLPQVVCLCKGNMIPRHLSKEFMDRVYQNTYFTYLFDEKEIANKELLLRENMFIEDNNDWYVESPSHPHRYFDSYNSLLSFIYRDPVFPKYHIFAPGACYIVRREQIKKHSPQFYLNLNKIMNYGLDPNFPSEAHQIERMLPTIFEANYREQEWMNDEKAFELKLEEQLPLIRANDALRGKRFKSIRRLLKRYD